ncbi:hypothetical protein [Gorillibacterium sp. CAU 1737]|uniref:hypothetical protein n=1 Tax=Gorillibacterium sp. CAU 1737 TaxID=3140362 RepID=UPI00326137F8
MNGFPHEPEGPCTLDERDELELLDRRLLNLVQQGIPLTEDPYGDLGRSLGLSVEEVLERLQKAVVLGVIRRLGAVLHPSRLGYVSGLYALEVKEDRMALAVSEINRHPLVTHNYRRDGRLNLWFTLSASCDEEKTRILKGILHCAEAPQLYEFPSQQVFKLKVYLDMEG